MTNQEKTGWDERTKRIIAATVAKDLSPNGPDMAHFEHLCISKGLDPLAKEVWCVMRRTKEGGNRPTFMLSIDGFLKLANSTGQLDGIEIIFYDGDGNSSEVWLTNTAPAACVAKAYRKGCARPFSASCRFDAYAQNSPLWKKLPEVMLSKVATTLALRRGFSDVLAGLHSPEEMDQSGMVPPEVLGHGGLHNTDRQHEVIERPVDDLHHGGLQDSATAAPPKKPTPPTPAPPKTIADAAEELATATDGKVTQLNRNPIKKVAKKVVKNVDIMDSALPERDDFQPTVQKLYELAQKRGMTMRGWRSLQYQFNCVDTGFTPAQATQVLKKLVEAPQDRITNLNKGLSTLGENLEMAS